jgi:hypothetical protein
VRIYVASSWRNHFQPDVVKALRADGHDVYDFKETGDGWGNGGDGPAGFAWQECAHPGTDWKQWTIAEYIEALNHPRAVEGYRRDMDALEASDVCVMVMPCGPSASMEMGWACGAGKLVAVYVAGIREPDLMVKMAHCVTQDLGFIRSEIMGLAEQRRANRA